MSGFARRLQQGSSQLSMPVITTIARDDFNRVDSTSTTITLHDKTLTEAASGTTLDVASPTLSDGDVLVIAVADESATPAWTMPTGFTQLVEQNASSTDSLYIAYKVITSAAGEPASYTFSSLTAPASAIAVSYSGVDNTTPLDVATASTNTGGATSETVPGITTVTAGAMLVSAATMQARNAADFTGPTGWTLEQDTSGTGRRLALADLAQTNVGPTGSVTWTLSQALANAATLFALRPATGGGGGLGVADIGGTWSTFSTPTWYITDDMAGITAASGIDTAAIATLPVSLTAGTVYCDMYLSPYSANTGVCLWANGSTLTYLNIQLNESSQYDRIALSKAVNGTTTWLSKVDSANLVNGTGYSLAVVLTASDITVYVDGVQKIYYTFTSQDLEDLTSKNVGLRSWFGSDDDDGGSRWDRYLVTNSTAVPASRVPAAPWNVVATNAGDGQANITWNRGGNGGSAITSYTLTSSAGYVKTGIDPAATSYTATGLDDVAQTFTLTAINAVGPSGGAISNSVTPAAVTVPDPPTAIAATPGDASAVISYAAPENNGGSAITSYMATSTPGGFTGTHVGADDAPITVNGLTNGTAYTFTVHATNSVGDSAESAASNSVTPAAGSSGNLLTWAPPTLTSPTTITLSNSNRQVNLDPTKDYIISMPTVIDVKGGIQINGGRNIVLIGGSINLSQWYGGTDAATSGNNNRALYIKGATSAGAGSPNTVPRTVHIEGLLIDGYLAEGIDFDFGNDTGVTVQIENCRINGALMGSYNTNHADGVQWWNGPLTMRYDRLTIADTHYQGFMIQPAQFGTETGYTADVRNTDIYGNNTDSAGLIYNTSACTTTCTNVYVVPDPNKSYPSQVIYNTSTNGITKGYRPGGDACPSGVAGVGYVSPGYM